MNYIGRHPRIDLTSQLDESSVLAILARFPGEVKGINGNAMPAEARAGKEGHEAEWLGFSCVDHLPNIYAHGRIDDLEFVNQSDVHSAKSIFQKLGGFSNATRRDGHEGFDSSRIK